MNVLLLKINSVDYHYTRISYIKLLALLDALAEVITTQVNTTD